MREPILCKLTTVGGVGDECGKFKARLGTHVVTHALLLPWGRPPNHLIIWLTQLPWCMTPGTQYTTVMVFGSKHLSHCIWETHYYSLELYDSRVYTLFLPQVAYIFQYRTGHPASWLGELYIYHAGKQLEQQLFKCEVEGSSPLETRLNISYY